MALLPSSDAGVVNSLTHPGTTAALQKPNFTALRTYLSDLLGTDSSNKPAARTALGAAALGANTDITSLGNQTSTIYTTSGTGTAYSITPTPGIASYSLGRAFRVIFHSTQGTNPTLQISGIATPPSLVMQTGVGTYVNAVGIIAGHHSLVVLISSSQALVLDIPQATGHGQCRLKFISTSQIRLDPFDGNRLMVNGVSCTVNEAGFTLSAAGLQPVFASTNRSITSNVATRTHAALAAPLLVGSQILVLDSGGAENYNGLKTVTASTTTTTSYACVAANEGTTADTGSVTPIYQTYATATAGAISAIEALLVPPVASTATANKGVMIRPGVETSTFVGTFTVAAGPVFANNVQSWFNRESGWLVTFILNANRVANVSYTNNTGKTMFVSGYGGYNGTDTSGIGIRVNGTRVSYTTTSSVGNTSNSFVSATVPAGATYLWELPFGGALNPVEIRQIN